MISTSSITSKKLTAEQTARLDLYQELLDEASTMPRARWTIRHWRVMIDRERSQGMFVILDPMDPAHEMYLTEAEYKALVTTSLRASTTIKVISRPDSVYDWEPVPTSVEIASHNSSLLQGEKILSPAKTETSKPQGVFDALIHGDKNLDPSKKGSPQWRGVESIREFASFRSALPLLKASLFKSREPGLPGHDLSLDSAIALYKAWQRLSRTGPALVKPKGGKTAQLVWGKS